MVYSDLTSSARVTQQTLDDGRVLTFSYFIDRTVVTATGLDGKVDTMVYWYAADNTLTQISVNGSSQLSTGFDANMTPEIARDARENSTRTIFNTRGQPTTIFNALGQRTDIAYTPQSITAQSYPIAITDTLRIATSYEYDGFNNVTRMVQGITTPSPLRLTTIYTYTTDGRFLQQMRRPDGVVTQYDYTSGRLTAQEVGIGTSIAQRITYSYDAVGRITNTTVFSGTTAYRSDRAAYNPDNTLQ